MGKTNEELDAAREKQLARKAKKKIGGQHTYKDARMPVIKTKHWGTCYVWVNAGADAHRRRGYDEKASRRFFQDERCGTL